MEVRRPFALVIVIQVGTPIESNRNRHHLGLKMTPVMFSKIAERGQGRE